MSAPSVGGVGDPAVGRRPSPRSDQPLYRPPGRRLAADPPPVPAADRRPPRQLYVPPRGRRLGLNRPSSPGFSTCSEIVTSWRTAPDAGPARPPPGPRRRVSQQTRQHVERLAEASAAQEDARSGPGGSPQHGSPPEQTGKRSGRRRRRGGRRSRSSSEDRSAVVADGQPSFQVPLFPLSPTATAPRPAHVPWRSNAASGRFTPTPERETARPAAVRPRFQQPYQPPALRDRPASAAAELPPSPQRQPYSSHGSPQQRRGAPADSPRRGAATPNWRDSGDPRSPPAWEPTSPRGTRKRRSQDARTSPRVKPPRDGAGVRPSPAAVGSDLIGAQPASPEHDRSPSVTACVAPSSVPSSSVVEAVVEMEVDVEPALPERQFDLLVNTTDDEKASLSARRVVTETCVRVEWGASGEQPESWGGRSPVSVLEATTATMVLGSPVEVDDSWLPAPLPSMDDPESTAPSEPSRTEQTLASDPAPSRRRSSASSGVVYEQFDWADEMEEWEKNYTDDGEPTGKVAPPAAPRPVIDYLAWRPPSPPPAEEPDGAAEPAELPSHVLEVYDFPAAFTTQDLTVVFQEFGARGFDVRWVDDTHALAVFASASAAAVAETLLRDHPLVRCRPLSQASPKARQKAARCQQTAELLPHRPRPETCALQARRMVFSALGRRDSAPREQREQERRQLQTARDKKRLAAKQKQDAWEGNFS
ncbi:serine/arginine repetitive matrix protein 1-like [Amphibalanus amphitrite]|uniref:serine/arginine repetitive matrix protein 1-like n=2 Tax=Amphibalanus amphitrite TaxID=1232801 RepID=UPI001C8FEF7A|nr:serine/arginine repetitive matrix protein 1-like [Amphibalanus amphitrite]XP_043232120.1 serine/arginine repetitive matrix protein 1-like [Amphibalanus amphitrite]